MSVLVIGDGSLGKEIINQTGWDFISRKKDGITTDNFDEWMWMLHPYDVIVNCIANTNTYSNDKEVMMRDNYKFVTHLVNFCNEMGKKLVHISTDYVYAGSYENASEDSITVPDRNWYSLSKLFADEHIVLFGKNYLICRLSHKPYPFPYDDAWVDVLTNADYTSVISDLVVRLIEGNGVGIYNVGTEIKTIYELAMKTKEVNPINSPIHVPKNVTMNINKLKHFLNL
jgi:nucleoside-diphosphate-sugar epimerase